MRKVVVRFMPQDNQKRTITTPTLNTRYELEPYILDFARFHEKDILEIGIGMGADHVEWARANPRSLTGIDLTPKAIEHTQKRLALYGFESDIRVADTEKLLFSDNSFDLVYSFGVLHHSPNTPHGINEVYRVLRPGGITRIMIYHTYSLTGYMLWLRYGLFSRPSLSVVKRYLCKPLGKSRDKSVFGSRGSRDVH